MFKIVFDFLTDPLGLPIEWYWECLILAVIGFATYLVAYRAVGGMYDSGAISGSGLGSFFHWLIRLVLFAVIWAIAYGAIMAAKWLYTNWAIVLCILSGVVILVGIIVTICILRRRKAGKEVKDDAGNEE